MWAWIELQTLWAQLILAGALCVDAFSTAVALGMSKIRFRSAIFFAGIAAIFHAWFPLLSGRAGGWGGTLVGWYAPLVSGMIFSMLGIQMIWTAFYGKSEHVKDTAYWRLTLIAFLISADSLTAGFSIGLIRSVQWSDSLIFGLFALVFCTGGWLVGRRLPKGQSKWGTALGGMILFAFGMQHLLQWI